MSQSITIDLSESNNAKKFNSNNLIHVNEFNRATKWILERIDSVDSKVEERLHETITILGTRGSGKTSFLLSLIEQFKSKELEVIDIIDPTLIEDKGHVFLNVIASIKRKVDKVLDANECNPISENYQIKTIWETKLNKLSNGLPSIDGIGGGFSDQSWQDAQYIMEKGIKAVSSAQELEENFHELLSQGLIILKKKAFLITFDDIDIDFKKGWPVLETIRKYFTSSNIITLISGDIRLYSLSIRKNLQHDINMFNNQSEDDKAFVKHIVTEMEGQYLQKIMKPERRIFLSTLAEKKDYTENLDINIKSENKIQNIIILYIEILKTFGINNRFQAKTYSDFLLSLPIRTQIRFLSLFLDSNKDYQNIIQAFISDLYAKRVDTDQIASNYNLININILNLLIREKFLLEGYQLQPISDNQSLNSCLVALSFLYSNMLKQNHPEKIFDYFIKIGFTRNLLPTIGYAENSDDSNTKFTPSIQGFCKHSGIMQDGVLRDISCNMTAYIRGFLNSKNQTTTTWAGTIPLRGLAHGANNSKVDNLNRIDYVFSNLKADIKTLAYIPLGLYNYSFKNEKTPCYSIITLLGTIGELLRIAKNKDLNAIKKGLQELSQIRTYSMPEFSDRMTESDIFYFSDNPEKESSELLDDEFLLGLETWMQEFNPEESISPHLLGKISTRFFYALENIQPRQSDNLGIIFHAQITAFMNSVLIEDVKENMDYVNININNTNYSDTIFTQNLLKVLDTQINNKLALSRWILSCPLLISYINHDSENMKNAITSFCNNNTVMAGFKTSIYKYLQNVSTKGSGKASQTKSILKKDKKIDEIILFLSANNIPFDWFKTGNKGTTTLRNKNIKSNLEELFGNDDDSSGKIRKIREYIASWNIKW